MLIKIDKDGRRLVSVTKPERKKLTDALEFLATIEANLNSQAAAQARRFIHEALNEIDNAVAATPKPTAAGDTNQQAVLSNTSAISRSQTLDGDYEVESVQANGGVVRAGSHVTFNNTTTDGKIVQFGGVVRHVFTRHGQTLCAVDADNGMWDVFPSIVTPD